MKKVIIRLVLIVIAAIALAGCSKQRTLDPNYAGIVSKGTVKAYLYRAVRNTALDRLDHRRVREERKEEKQQETAPTSKTSPVGALHNSELQEAMEAAVEALSGRQRLVYRLAHRHGLSYREIAAALGIARKTVANHMGRALKSLRSQLTEYISFLQ